jgi:hypothetical protein
MQCCNLYIFLQKLVLLIALNVITNGITTPNKLQLFCVLINTLLGATALYRMCPCNLVCYIFCFVCKTLFLQWSYKFINYSIVVFPSHGQAERHYGFREKSWSMYVNKIQYRERFQMSLDI